MTEASEKTITTVGDDAAISNLTVVFACDIVMISRMIPH